MCLCTPAQVIMRFCAVEFVDSFELVTVGLVLRRTRNRQLLELSFIINQLFVSHIICDTKRAVVVRNCLDNYIVSPHGKHSITILPLPYK